MEEIVIKDYTDNSETTLNLFRLSDGYMIQFVGYSVQKGLESKQVFVRTENDIRQAFEKMAVLFVRFQEQVIFPRKHDYNPAFLDDPDEKQRYWTLSATDKMNRILDTLESKDGRFSIEESFRRIIERRKKAFDELE